MITTVEKFVKAAIDHGRYTEVGNPRACNKAYDRVIQALRELRASADHGESVLSEFLTHPNSSVRTWAATHLLTLQEALACAALEELASSVGPSAFDAKMTLKEWRAGRLVVP